MTQRTETLAAAFEQVAGRILTMAEGLSDAAWGVAPAGEARTAGQIAYHTAAEYHTFSGFIQLAVGGQPLPALTMEILHGLNAAQATRYAGAGRAGALELLRQNGAATAAMLRTLSDAQLDTGTAFFGHPMTVESLAHNGLVAHAEEHLASMQGAAATV
ncbi:MAG: DinB family protein [Roseiflexaceae bacterium]